MSAPKLEVEALFVSIYAEHEAFTVNAVKEISVGVDKIINKFSHLTDQLSLAGVGIQQIFGSIKVSIASGIADINNLATSIAGVVTSLQQFQIGSLTAGLGQLVDYLSKLANTNLGNIGANLKTLGDAFLQSGLWKANVGRAAVNLSALGHSLADLWTGVSITDLARNMQSAGVGVVELSRAFESSTLHLKKVTTAAVNLQELAKGVEALAKVSHVGLTDVGTAIEAVFPKIGEGLKKFGATPFRIKGLVDLTAALAGFNSVPVDKLTTLEGALKSLFPALGAALISSGLQYERSTDGIKAAKKALEGLMALTTSLSTLHGLDLGKVKKGFEDLVPAIAGLAVVNPAGLKTATDLFAQLAGVTANLGPSAVAVTGLFAAVASASSTAVLDGATALARIGQFVRAVSKADLSQITASVGPIRAFTVEFAQLATIHLPKIAGADTLPQMLQLSAVLRRLATFLNATSDFSPRRFRAMMVGVEEFARSFSLLSTVHLGNVVPQMAALADVFSKVSGLVRLSAGLDVQKFGAGFGAIDKAMSALATSFGGINATAISSNIAAVKSIIDLIKGVTKAGADKLISLSMGLNALGPALQRFQGLGAMPDLSSLKAFVQSMGKADVVVLYRIGRGIKELAQGLISLGTANLTNAFAGTAGLTKWLQQFNSMSPVVIKNVSAIGKGLAGFAAFLTASGGGGALPSVTNNITHMGGAAEAASGRTRGLFGRLRDLAAGAMEASTSMRYLRISLAGIAGISLGVFAKLDDHLTRILAHLRDWQQQFRPLLEHGLAKIAGGSITSQAELAKSLDVLVRSGQSPALALESLGIMETFAVASGMELEKATQRITVIMRMMGLEVNDATKYIKNLTDTTDKFAAVGAAIPGSTEKLVEGFSHRGISAFRQFGVGMDDAIALMGTYALAGIDSAHAGDLFARSIDALVNSENAAWLQLQLLGSSITDTKGKLLPMSQVIEQLTNMLGGRTPQALKAIQEKLGHNFRAIAGIIPLTGMKAAFDNFKAMLTSSEGIAEQMANMVRQDLIGNLKNLWNNVKNVAYEIGKSLSPAVYYLAEGLRQAAQWFMSLNPAVRNLIVLSTFLAAALTVVGAVTAFFVSTLIIAPIAKLVGVFMSLATGLWSASRAAMSLVPALWRVARAAVSGLWTVLSSAAGALWDVFNVPIKVIRFLSDELGSTLADIWRSARRLGMAAITSIGQALLSLLAGFVSFLTNLVVWTPLIVPITGVLVGIFATMAIGAVQAFRAIGAAAVSMWGSIKSGADAAGRAIANSIKSGADLAVDKWKEMKQSFDLKVLATGLEGIAGFFWHFQENMAVFFTWWRVNWENASGDISQAIILAIENTAANIWAFGKAISYAVLHSFTTVSGVIKEYFMTVIDWVRHQWKNMTLDLNNIFKTLFVNIFRNIMTGIVASATVFAKAFGTAWLIANKAFLGGGFGTEDIQVVIAKATSKAMKSAKFVGPFEGAPESETHFGLLGKMLGATGRWASTEFGGLGKGISGAFREFSEGLVPILKGFKPTAPWGKMLEAFNTKLPSNAFERFLKSLTGFSPFGGEEGGVQLAGRQSPGFQFKQISLERTMLGGVAEETIEKQQLLVLQAIQKDTANLAAAAGRKPGMPFNPIVDFRELGYGQ